MANSAIQLPMKPAPPVIRIFIENEKTGILIRPDDIDALAEAVLDLLEDRSKNTALVQQAEKIARQRFDSRACALAIADLYDELLKQR